MNRTKRQFALVEELRAAAPEPRAAKWLAGRLNVSTRTVERDLADLQSSGVPVFAGRGRRGGYVLADDRVFPFLAMSSDEVVAISVALRELVGVPVESAARTALEKIVAAMPPQDQAKAEQLAHRVRPVAKAGPKSTVPKPIQRALESGHVLHLRYRDGNEVLTDRVVEPIALLHGPRGWYLLAWCRLREAPRGFLLDRVHSATVGEDTVVDRGVAPTLRIAG